MSKPNPRRPIVVHVYRIDGGHRTFEFSVVGGWKSFAEEQFADSTVYKVKVWDTRKGDIEPNNPNAEALVLEWV